MASNQNTYEEILRLVLETQGQEGLDRLRVALAEVGDVSDETVAQTTKLIDGLAELNRKAGAAAEFDALSESIGQTEVQLDEAQKRAYQLTLALGATEKPSRELQRAQTDAKAEVERLEKAFAGQWASLLKIEGALSAAGVDTRNLATLQQDLRAQVAGATAAVERQAKAVQAEATAQAQLKQRMADGDEQFRKQAQASRAAAEALESYRARTAAADAQTRKLVDSSRIVDSTMGRLRGVLAGLTGLFSLHAAVEGTKNILGLGDAAEIARKRLDRLYGAGNGQAAFDQIRQLARDSGAQFDAMLQSALKLKTFGLEPLDGTLKGLIDQNALLGGFMDSLDGIILAVGQAWSKQKLQGEEIMQLVERGVPVWDLLAKATGKNVTELQRLSSAGQLGKDVIRELLDEMANSSSGAAADSINTLSRLWTAFVDRVQGFARDIANSGALDYFKRQLREISAAIDVMASNGGLARWAQKISDAIVGAASGVKRFAAEIGPLLGVVGNATIALAKHAQAVIFLGKVYLALKLTAVASSFLGIATAAGRATVATQGLAAAEAARATGIARLGGMLAAIPRVIKVTFAVGAIDFLLSSIQQLNTAIGEYNDAMAKTERFEVNRRVLAQEQIQRGKQLQDLYRSSAQVQIASAEELRAKTEDQALEYRFALQQATAYFQGVVLQARGAGDKIAESMAATRVAGLRKALQDVQDTLRGMSGLSEGARGVIENLRGIDRDAKNASSSIKTLFDGLNYANPQSLADVALALAQISARSDQASQNVRDGLLATLQQLSGVQLQQFQKAAADAFDAFNTAPAQAAAILDSTLYAALEKLGVSADRMGTKFTTAGRDAVAAFGAIVENANATGQQVEAAFNGALGKVSTLDDARALGEVLRSAGEQGRIGFDQAERSAAALAARISGITAAMDPLTDAFGQLGIQSQASLNAARDSAKAAFEAIRSGAYRGTAAIEDVRRAFDAYSRAARAAVADSDASAKYRVDSELEVLDAIYKVNDGLDEMGRRGGRAGDGIKAGASGAADALRELRGVGDEVGNRVGKSVDKGTYSFKGFAQAAEDAGKAGGQADQVFVNVAGSMAKAGASASALTFSLGEVSQAWMEAFDTIGKNAVAGSPVVQWFADITNELTRQREQVRGLIAEQQKLLATYDEDASRRNQLRAQYKFVGDSEIEQLLQAEKQVKAAEEARIQRKRQEAEAQNQADLKRIEAAKELAKAQGDITDASSGGGAASTQTIVIDWRGPTKSVTGGATAEEQAYAARIAAMVGPEFLRLVQKSRAISNVRIKR
ncbi:MAG: hypothetical protein DI597_05360 [Pseudoxanthomonas spadix]|nr:MAG: hypothetical protein DI597_05360 [Pseudoxanthomonas spadix]